MTLRPNGFMHVSLLALQIQSFSHKNGHYNKLLALMYSNKIFILLVSSFPGD